MPKVMKRDLDEILRQVDEDIKHAQVNHGGKVQCPSCGGIFFETTDKFDIMRVANPSMIRLAKPYSEYGWTEPIPDASAGFGSMVCPECESMLAPDGKLTLMGGDKE